MNKTTTVGIDLAKEVFAVCVLNERGDVIERCDLRREAFEHWSKRLAPCTVAMEACSSAHFWGRWFAARGHTIRLMAAGFVAPFRKGGKSDSNDAEAIAIACGQSTMRFVPVKSAEQQAILAWHSARLGWNEERTALINRVRGVLTEFGVVLGRSSATLLKALPALCADDRLPLPVRGLLLEAREQFVAIEARLARCDAEITAHVSQQEAAARVREVIGIGPLTASVLVASVPPAQAHLFGNARQFAAWLGLTPRQHSSEGKTRLGRVSRRGNTYLRTLLVQGARSTLLSALRVAPERASRLQRWILTLYARKGYFKTLVAIANKHARIVWMILANGDRYDPNAWQLHGSCPQT
jgi:transposase